jgi:hypothetical protein
MRAAAGALSPVLALSHLANEIEPLVPECSVLMAQHSLAERRPLVVNRHLRHVGGTVWVTDPVSSLETPYVVGPEVAAHLTTLVPGSSVPTDIPENVSLSLLLAGIITDPKAAREERQAWESGLRACSVSFARFGYAVVRGLLPPLLLGGLRRHFRRLVSSGSIRLGDAQSQRRYVAHNEAGACFIHQQLLRTMCTIASLAVKPSYVYAASYLRGAILPRHTDREQCQYSVSLCLDYSPEPDGPTSWPLWLDTVRGPTPVHQSLGDALFYRGCILPHFRTQFTAGDFSTSLFLHYVDERFTGPLN